MKTIKQIIREEIDDFDWVRDIEPTQGDIAKFIRNNPDETVWRFGKHWEGNLNLSVTNITDLGELEHVGGSLRGTKIQSLGNLKKVDIGLYLGYTPIQSLGNLEQVGDGLYLRGTQIKDLGNLKSIGGNLDLIGTPLSKNTTISDIRKQIWISGYIFL